MKKITLAVVGASGLVGQKMLEVINEYKIEFDNLYLYTSKKSAGKQITYQNKTYTYIELTPESIIEEIDLAFFSCGGDNSLIYAPIFAKNKTYVVDNSSAFRTSSSHKLVIPEINKDVLHKNDYIISNPNCSTTQALLPLHVVNELFGAKRVDYVTYQAVSGSGVGGIKDLELTSNGQQPQTYPYQIANNVIAQIGNFQSNGFSDEEIKMVNESQKILNHLQLEVSAMCVRVPVVNSHSVNLQITTKKEIDVTELIKQLQNFEGIVVCDNSTLAQPLIASGSNDVFVSRIRKDLFNKHVVHLFCVSDNLRKGAATNSIQIGMHVIKHFIK